MKYLFNWIFGIISLILLIPSLFWSQIMWLIYWDKKRDNYVGNAGIEILKTYFKL